MKKIGIYVHIPFCAKKCNYCDFISFQNKEDKINEYVQVLKKEIENCKFTGFDVSTIYIGGGTPSLIESHYIAEIVKKIREKFIVTQNAEITIEVNPGTVDLQKLQDYKNAGINRLSIGMQSTDNMILKQIGRIHTFEDFLEIYKNARKVGFKNINVDLMIALPDENEGSIAMQISELINLKPEHISCYSLILEDGTRMKKMVEKRRNRFAVR